MLKGLLKKKEKPTGITCHYCGWQGERDTLHTARVLNTDGTPYTIHVCPQCMRNGGLIYHDEAK